MTKNKRSYYRNYLSEDTAHLSKDKDTIPLSK